MRAAVMRAGQLVVDDVPVPVPGPGQVLVRTIACGICGSDLHALAHGPRLVEASARAGQPMRMDLSRDVVMGHEFCAEIVDHGPGSPKTLPVGARVCSPPILVGNGTVEAVGYSNVAPGGYGEYMVLFEPLLSPVPNGLASEHAALTEPMAVGLHAVEAARITGDDVVAVIGLGPVGLAVVACLRLRGVAPIVAADLSPARRSLAERLGAHIVVDPQVDSPYSRLGSLARGAGDERPGPVAALLGGSVRPTVIFECVGVPGMLQQAFEGALRGTRIVVVGVCMESDTVEPIAGIYKELSVKFVLGYTPEEFARTLRHIAEGELDAAPLVTGRVGVDEIPAAFAQLRDPGSHAKILAEPWR